MEKFDRKAVEEKLRELPVEAVVAIGLRSAMRTLPMLAIRRTESDQGFWFWQESDRPRFLFALLRAYAAASSADTTHAAAYAAANAAAAAANAAYAAAADAAAYAADAAAYAADAAAYAASAAAYAASAAAAADAAAYAASSYTATLESDIGFAKWAQNPDSRQSVKPTALALFERPLWPGTMAPSISDSWLRFREDAENLNAGFEIWLDWYQQRLDGGPIDFKLESACAALSEERLAQTPAEINAYLKSQLEGASETRFHRVRAIFIGHGGVGKTSLIRVLHREDVIEGQEAMTPGVAIENAIHDGAGVFTRVTALKESELTVHFWDFGGQVMAHATHQFFLRAKCLYVIVLDGRAERNSNEEAEYWLEHVRAFGEGAPVLLVGNKADQAKVNLDLRTLKEKHPNIIDFYPLSCTKAKGQYHPHFERFRTEFGAALADLGRHGERFTQAEFSVLKDIEGEASREDFLPRDAFSRICATRGIEPEGPKGRATLLDLFDKLGVVMHFPRMAFLDDYVLNPRWLTYGVYTVMYSERANAAKGRIREADVIEILKQGSLLDRSEKRQLHYTPERCRLIVDSMVAFGIAYRLAHAAERLVIPALLEPLQPEHDFKPDGALAFRLDFKGFLPRHVLPALIVDNHQDIANVNDHEVVWQNGVLLRAGRGLDAEALIKADYHERYIDVRVKGSDALLYLSIIRDGILKTLQTMSQLPYEEKVQLRPDMRVDHDEAIRFGDTPVWLAYNIIRTAQKNRIEFLPGPDGFMYKLDNVLAVTPIPPDMRRADVFISYASGDRTIVEELSGELESSGRSVWFDRDLIAGQKFRSVIGQRIDAAKALIVIWTGHSIASDWVVWEASRAHKAGKLICLRDPSVERKNIPAPFPSNDHILNLGDREGLRVALDRLGVPKSL